MWSIVQKQYPFCIANANGSNEEKARPTSTRSVCRASGFVQTALPETVIQASWRFVGYADLWFMVRDVGESKNGPDGF